MCVGIVLSLHVCVKMRYGPGPVCASFVGWGVPLSAMSCDGDCQTFDSSDVCVCMCLECDGQETCSGTNHQFHYTSGEGELSYTQHTNSSVSLSFSQERYLASLMPLKRDVSPWRVSQWLYCTRDSGEGSISCCMHIQCTIPPPTLYVV